MRLIDADELRLTLEKAKRCATNDFKEYTEYEDKSFFRGKMAAYASSLTEIDVIPTISPDSLRPKGLYTAHEVAEIIAELFGDNCACNFNGIDEWLSEKCELGDACPNTVGVACWEQYLKHRHNCGADMREEKT